MHQAAKRAGAAIGDAAAREDPVPDREPTTPEASGPPDPDCRRLLGGYAEPGRVRRLKDRQRRRQAARCGRLRRWLWRLLRRRPR